MLSLENDESIDNDSRNDNKIPSLSKKPWLAGYSTTTAMLLPSCSKQRRQISSLQPLNKASHSSLPRQNGQMMNNRLSDSKLIHKSFH